MPDMRFAMLCLALAANFPFPASAQGIYAADGFGATASYSSGDIGTYGVDLGYVAKGRLELGLGFSQSSDSELKATNITPRLAIYALRAKEGLPVTLSLSTSYGATSYSGDALEELQAFIPDADISGSTFSFGGDLTMHMQLFEVAALLPTVSIRRAIIKLELTGYGGTEKNSVNGTSFLVGLPIAISAGESRVLHLGPTFELLTADGESDGAIGFRAGLVLVR
ncbi:MAG: hypothetical protein ACI80V_003134 [Rhodothermales bacterium]|jgi:hypothetical protein